MNARGTHLGVALGSMRSPLSAQPRHSDTSRRRTAHHPVKPFGGPSRSSIVLYPVPTAQVDPKETFSLCGQGRSGPLAAWAEGGAAALKHSAGRPLRLREEPVG